MPAFPRGKLISAEWTIRDPSECCTPDSPFDLSYEFCMALCVLCCSTLTLTFEGDKNGLGAPIAQPFDDTRDFPVVSPSANGLSFTTSQYGLFIPIVFGSDKLNGNVFWSSVIRRNNITVAGQPFFYNSVDFALGICEGEINGVLRMWIGDKLILDNTAVVDVNGVAQPSADGFILGSTIDVTDPESPLRGLSDAVRQTKISVFTGSETQIPEGIMVAAEGYENVPAYRGLAYVLFENFVVAEGNIPNLYVEVTSNTQTLFPRVFGDLEDTVFTAFNTTMLLCDPSYDRIHVIGTKAADNTFGVATYDGNSLEEVAQHIVVDDDVGDQFIWHQSWLTQAGLIVFNRAVGNQGIVATYNPFIGDIMNELGPGGTIGSHSLTTGFGALGAGSFIFQGIGSNGIPVDALCGIGSLNGSVGFAEITDRGEIVMASTLNAVLTLSNDKAQVIYNDAAFSALHPTFADSTPTLGTHIYIFSFSTNEATRFKVSRVTLTDENLSSPVFTPLADISVAQLAGTGFGHNIKSVTVDPTDNCFFMQISVASRSGRFAKWSPFTGQFVWITAVPEFPTALDTAGGEVALLSGQKYVWVSNSDELHSIDLKTGETLLIDTLGTQNLPAHTGSRQFYNGYENALYYQSATAAKHIVKVFIDRLARATVELSDVISNLLRRVGLLNTDIGVEDLTALTLNGYTISQVTSLRTSFSELGRAFTYDVIESNGKIKYKTRGSGPLETIHHKWLGADNDGWMRVVQQNEGARIRKINLTYRDIDREYGQNVQSVILSKHGGHQFDEDAAIDVTVPIVLDSETARQLAEILIYSKLVYNTQYKIRLPARYQNLDPADVLRFQMDDAGTDFIDTRFREVDIGDDGSIDVQASQEDPDIYTDQVNLFGNVGRFERSSLPSFPRRIDPLVLLIPYLDESEAQTSQYQIFVTFLNSREDLTFGENITIVVNGTERVTFSPPPNFPTWGYVMDPPTATRALFSTDNASELRVALVSTEGAVMESTTKAEMLDNDFVNLCYIAGELMQFETATDEGDNVWLLTGLHRAKLGTDPFANKGRRGDKFVLVAGSDGVVDRGAILNATIAVGDSPRKALQVFMNTGNPFQPSPVVVYTAMNLRPWVVADVKREFDGNDAEFSWQRRTRFGGVDEWNDDTETVPLNELEETYELYLYTDPAAFVPFDPLTYLRKVEVGAPSFSYTAAMQAADGYVNTVDDLYCLVYQTGSNTGIDSGAGVVKRLQHK